MDFVDISYLIHFAITSLVTFTELCILLCYEVFVLRFRKRVFNLRLIFVRHFVCPSSVLSELSIIFNFTILHSISLFCTGEIALFTDLGLIDMFSANQTAEIVACILLYTLKDYKPAYSRANLGGLYYLQLYLPCKK